MKARITSPGTVVDRNDAGDGWQSDAYLSRLSDQGLIEGHRLLRSKLGFKPPALREFHIMIETREGSGMIHSLIFEPYDGEVTGELFGDAAAEAEEGCGDDLAT